MTEVYEQVNQIIDSEWQNFMLDENKAKLIRPTAKDFPSKEMLYKHYTQTGNQSLAFTKRCQIDNANSQMIMCSQSLKGRDEYKNVIYTCRMAIRRKGTKVQMSHDAFVVYIPVGKYCLTAIKVVPAFHRAEIQFIRQMLPSEVR